MACQAAWEGGLLKTNYSYLGGGDSGRRGSRQVRVQAAGWGGVGPGRWGSRQVQARQVRVQAGRGSRQVQVQAGVDPGRWGSRQVWV